MLLVKTHQQKELQKLESSRKPIEDEIRALNEVLREKYEELDKIELRASERLSKLSELNSKVKDREKELRGLESDSERLSDLCRES